MQAKDKREVRAYLMARAGVTKVRIRADGGTDAYGPMANTGQIGWYFAGWANDLLSMAAAEKPKRLGRPPLPPEQRRGVTPARTVRLDDARWEKLRRLGREWLEHAIDQARET